MCARHIQCVCVQCFNRTRLITPLWPVLWLLIHDKADATRPIALPRWRPRCCRVRHHGRQFKVGSSTGTTASSTHWVRSPVYRPAHGSFVDFAASLDPGHIQSRLMDFPLLKLLLTRPVLARADRTHHDKGGLNYWKGVLVVWVRREGLKNWS